MIPFPPQRRRVLLIVAGSVCAVFALVACVMIWRKPVPQGIASILKEVGFDQRLGQDVPLDLAFRDEAGRGVSLREYFKKRPVVLSFVYYQCPMLCTQVQTGLVHSLRAMNLEPGEDFELVTVSIDGRDTIEQAAKKKESYLAEYGNPRAASYWHFLTSPLEADPSAPASAPQSAPESPPAAAPTGQAAARLAQEVGFRYFYDKETDQFAHASGIVVLTPEGQVSKYFYGIDYSPRDLRLALVEASSGEIGTWMDQALLLCYHYDPLTGTYGVVILTVIRFFAVVTILLIAGLVTTLIRQERRALHISAGGA